MKTNLPSICPEEWREALLPLDRFGAVRWIAANKVSAHKLTTVVKMMRQAFKCAAASTPAETQTMMNTMNFLMSAGVIGVLTQERIFQMAAVSLKF